ncbi:hypothetical protein NMY22_g16674 [Coprinellus aureogranulatus]|nr:hypothetical protein NMY22_g16674 [Coprinellus aureogranulatus]
MALPSSAPDATMASLCGDQSVSRTVAVCPRASGKRNRGSLWGNPGLAWKGDGRGKMAKAPPPDEFQLTLIYCCVRCQHLGALDVESLLTPEADMMLVSQALFVTLTFS